MGFWFGIFDKGTPWRKTPAKINNSWYTPSGEKVYSPSRYFATVGKNGANWKGNTGWPGKKGSK